MINDHTQGGWIPPHEPSASCRSRTQCSATLTARLRRFERRGAPDCAAFRPPISLRSISLGRTGCSASTTDSDTIVCRAQQAKS
jgi:hypothetical protein